MKDKSTMTGIEYLEEILICSFISMIWYKNLLFHCIPQKSYEMSRYILYGMIIFFLVISLICFRYRKSAKTVAITVILPYGIYTLITYFSIRQKLITRTLIIVIILAGLYCVLRMTRKVRCRKKLWRTVKGRIYDCMCVSQGILALGLILIMLVIASGRIFGNTLLKSSVKPVQDGATSEETINNNMKTILLLQEEKWESLSAQNRLDVLQVVANIECHYNGLPNEINVGVASLGEYTLGAYDDNTHTVFINIDHLKNDTAHSVLDTLLHEVYHSVEYRMLDVYETTNPNFRNLRIFGNSRYYSDEFRDYKTGSNSTYDEYFEQYSEADSRAYAKEGVQDYYKRIEEYINK